MTDEQSPDDQTRGLDIISSGTVISRYTITEKIGAGGMGEVYLADDTQLRRKVALKFLPANLSSDQEFLDRFRREARATAGLSHQNIITLFDVGEWQGRPYIVMEYFHGKTLRSVSKSQKLTGAELVNIALQIASGLSQAHATGIIHRDIKSENILLGSEGVVKILDFGLAHIEHDVRLTRPGSAMGTIAYMSPEQSSGKQADHRSDLFSLGVVLYELATGSLPFVGDNVAAVINAILKEEPAKITNEDQELPAKLVDIIHCLLRKNPAERYQSASDLVDDLSHLSQNRLILPAGQRRVRWGRVVGVASTVIALCLGVWWNISGGFSSSAGESSHREKIAVLPFDNLGIESDQFFVTGMMDEITMHLARIHGLGVISRTSAVQYYQSGKPLDQIGRELGVGFVLEGSVQWARTSTSSRIRITVGLKDVSNNVTVWGDTYDKIFDDVFAIQTDIAKQVATAMNVTLLDSEEESIEKIPTENTEAYSLYLQGLNFFNSRDWVAAEQLLVKSTQIDSTFGTAWALLSRTHSQLYWWYVDRSSARSDSARICGVRALAHSPGSAEALLAMGRYYYRIHLDYGQALDFYYQALNIQPNNSDIMFAIGSVLRRQGKWSNARDQLNQAINLDPRSRLKLRSLSQTYFRTRLFDSALIVADQQISLTPDDHSPYAMKSTTLALGLGRVNEAFKVIERFQDSLNLASVNEIRNLLYLLKRDYQSSERLLQQMRESDFFKADSSFTYLLLGEVFHLKGDVSVASAYYDSARVILEDYIDQFPSEPAYRSLLGIAYAGVGNKQQAINQGSNAIDLCSLGHDAMSGASWRLNMLFIYVMVDELDLAMKEIVTLLSIPSELTQTYLRLHPIFDKLRDRSDFVALVN